MKVLLSLASGYQLNEISRPIYDPGYENPNLKASEHECLCAISKLVEARLLQEGVQVNSRKYDTPRDAEFAFDKARHARGCDLAVFLALNSSQNNTAQFSTAMVHMVQDENLRNIFEGVMHSLGRYVPVQSRYPNQMKRLPFLETCKRNGNTAVVILPFFYTCRNLTEETLGKLIEKSAQAIAEAILSYHPKDKEVS